MLHSDQTWFASLTPGSWTELSSGLLSALVAIAAVFAAWRGSIAQHSVSRELLDAQRREQASKVTWRCYRYKQSDDPRDSELILNFDEDLLDFDGYGHPYPQIFLDDDPRIFVIVEITNASDSHIGNASLTFHRQRREPFSIEQRGVASIPTGVTSLALEVESHSSQTANPRWEDIEVLKNSFVRSVEFNDSAGRSWRRMADGSLLDG